MSVWDYFSTGADVASKINPVSMGLNFIGSGLSGYFQGKAQKDIEKKKQKLQREQWAREDASKTAARTGLSSSGAFNYNPYGESYTPYNYTQYKSTLQPQQESTIAQYLSGQLTPAQQAGMAQTGRLGVENLGRTAAQSGMPSGGRSALAVQLARDLALGGGKMATENQQIGLQAALPYQQFQAGQQSLYQGNVAGEKEKQYGYGLADYLRKVQSQQELAKLMAQYQ